jgi:ferredoxin
VAFSSSGSPPRNAEPRHRDALPTVERRSGDTIAATAGHRTPTYGSASAGKGESCEFDCGPQERILHAGLRSGVELPYECASGTCGTCKATLVEGDTEYAWEEAPGRKHVKADKGESSDVSELSSHGLHADDRETNRRAGRRSIRAGARRRCRFKAHVNWRPA